MAIYKKQQLLSELLDRTDLISSSVQNFMRLSNEELNAQPAPGKWSIAAVFEHLNITNDIYIRRILKKMQQAPDIDGSLFRSGWLGDLAYEQIMPRPNGTVLKLKAPHLLRPSGDQLNGHEVLNRFLQQMDMIHDILRHAASKDLERIRIPLASTRMVSLRLGDSLRFVIAHCERHLLQAKKVHSLLFSVPG